MGTTAEFLKLRSSKTPKVGEWNIDYKTALAAAKKDYKFIVCCWSNGDACGYCTALEKVFMTAEFKNWIKTQDAYFVFQYSGDKDKGKTLHDLIYKDREITQYPGVRIVLFKDGKTVKNVVVTGNSMRKSKTGATGAKNAIAYLEKIFAGKPEEKPDEKPAPEEKENYKIRFNEKLTVKKVNAILDAIDKNDGHCPCQPAGDGTKCHCKDFLENKKIGEVCICNLFVKVPVVKEPGVKVTVKDYSKVDSSAPMTFMCSPRGPVIVNSPEELDDLNGEPRGTTKKMLRATGACRVTMIGHIKVPRRNSNKEK